MAINIPIAQIKTALSDAAQALIGSMGEDVTYTPKGGAAFTVRAVPQKLREEEMVGTYRNGDMRFTFDATKMPAAPKKFDEIQRADGTKWVIVDSIGTDKGIDNSVLVYRPVARGS